MCVRAKCWEKLGKCWRPVKVESVMGERGRSIIKTWPVSVRPCRLWEAGWCNRKLLEKGFK